MINPLSLRSIRLELKINDHSLSMASGLFYKKNDAIYLISNWHVFSGRNSYTGQPLSKTGAIPNNICFSLLEKNTSDKWSRTNRINLLDENENPYWFQHQNGQKYDIAAIPLVSFPEHRAVEFSDINKSILMPELSEKKPLSSNLQPSSEIFVIGHPLGINLQNGLPIWKKASVASEPQLPADGLPIVLIDTATREGMSGSPVYRYFADGQIPFDDGKKGKGIAFAIGNGPVADFIGLYSGRYGTEDELSAQIGRVWKKFAIDEMLDNPALGSYEINK